MRSIEEPILETPSSPSEADANGCIPLPAPRRIRDEIPLAGTAARTAQTGRRAIQNILRGADRKRLLVVCGPCSIHDVNAALDYALKLRQLARDTQDKLVLVMRTYFEKPRSVVGWKGLLYDPELQGTLNPANSLALARRLLVRVNEIGLPCATEFLNPLLPAYLQDAIAYGSIGSRTAESQPHREMASGLGMPVGLKNDMEGNLDSALNAALSASKPHALFGQSDDGQPAIVQTPGNPYAHPFLRGGKSGPNYDAASIRQAAAGMERSGLSRPVMVDCSHGNSSKDHTRQALVARSVAEQFRDGQNAIAGIMLESNLVPGQQAFQAGQPHRYGQSITDSCIGWEETESLVREIAGQI